MTLGGYDIILHPYVLNVHLSSDLQRQVDHRATPSLLTTPTSGINYFTTINDKLEILVVISDDL